MQYKFCLAFKHGDSPVLCARKGGLKVIAIWGMNALHWLCKHFFDFTCGKGFTGMLELLSCMNDCFHVITCWEERIFQEKKKF